MSKNREIGKPDQFTEKSKNMKTNFNNPKGLYIARPKGSIVVPVAEEDKAAINKIQGKPYIAYPNKQLTVAEVTNTHFALILQPGLFVAAPIKESVSAPSQNTYWARLRYFLPYLYRYPACGCGHYTARMGQLPVQAQKATSI